MTWFLVALMLVVSIAGGCAIVLGSNSRATVNTKAEREVTPDSTTIEDVLIQKDKKQ